MSQYNIVSLVISGLISITSLFAGEIDDATLKALNDDSFKIREAATKKLIESDLSIEAIQNLISKYDEPEVIHRLNLVIQGKMEIIGWAVLTREELIKRAKPCGNEQDGKLLYLVRIHHNGDDVIGKYMIDWQGGNFPIDQTEVNLPGYQTWIGKGTWRKWSKDTKKIIPMGKTKDGKFVYAARANHNDGVHPGTLIAGENKARISWGGEVNLFEDFEVLETE